MQKNSRESGQAIILVMLAMVGLIAMMGLALDGGHLLFLQRKAATTVDLAALSGATALCTGGDMYAVIQSVVEANGMDFSDVTITYPVTDRPNLALQSEMLRVTLTGVKEPFFIHIVYKWPIIYTASAITYCNTNRGVGEPASMYFVEVR